VSPLVVTRASTSVACAENRSVSWLTAGIVSTPEVLAASPPPCDNLALAVVCEMRAGVPDAPPLNAGRRVSGVACHLQVPGRCAGKRHRLHGSIGGRDRVFETYWTTLRGVEAMDYSYALMDLEAGRSDDLAVGP
jgi:hypothetical protein